MYTTRQMKTILAAAQHIQFIERNVSARWAFTKKGRENVCMKDGHIAYNGNGVKKKSGKGEQEEKYCDRK